jgi:hypothetical protein
MLRTVPERWSVAVILLLTSVAGLAANPEIVHFT